MAEGLQWYCSLNQMDRLLLVKLNGEPTSFVFYCNLHVVCCSNRRSLFVFALGLLASVLLHLYFFMNYLYAVYLYGIAVLESKPPELR